MVLFSKYTLLLPDLKVAIFITRFHRISVNEQPKRLTISQMNGKFLICFPQKRSSVNAALDTAEHHAGTEAVPS